MYIVGKVPTARSLNITMRQVAEEISISYYNTYYYYYYYCCCVRYPWEYYGDGISADWSIDMRSKIKFPGISMCECMRYLYALCTNYFVKGSTTCSFFQPYDVYLIIAAFSSNVPYKMYLIHNIVTNGLWRWWCEWRRKFESSDLFARW